MLIVYIALIKRSIIEVKSGQTELNVFDFGYGVQLADVLSHFRHYL